MQRLFDARAIIRAKGRHARAYVRDVLVRNGRIDQVGEVVFETRFRRASQIEHDLDDLIEVAETNQCLADCERKNVEELR
jgi:hypothetical protein